MRLKKHKTSFDKIAIHPLQSRQWAEFRRAWGNEVLETKYGIITLHKIPFTKYKIGMFLKGPMPTREMLNELKEFAKKNNLLFIKLEPNIAVNIYFQSHPEFISGSKTIPKQVRDDKSILIKLLKENGCVQGKTLFTPTTFWIDLSPSEDELLKSFSSKTRYNIRVAQRNGVEVVEDNSDRVFEIYLELMRETVERQGFYAHTEKYHRLMWQHLHRTPTTEHHTPIARLLTARYKREIITTWIVFVWKDFLYYPYGASSEKYKNVMANNLMMWEAIKFGKKLGLKKFDMWGALSNNPDKNGPWTGFHRFKQGYGPKHIEFLGSFDLVINPLLYKIYKTLDKIRWVLLKLKR